MGQNPLDETYFPSFAPLVSASQEYAKLSGCRFMIKAFRGIECRPDNCIPIVSEDRAGDAGPLLSAKLHAASQVYKFADLLQNGDAELHDDLHRAFDLVIKESARNSMIASCKAADFFPPPCLDNGVDSEDCSWDAVSSTSVAVIAQRLYNDESRRLQNTVDGRNLELVRAKTASFIVDFAAEVGVVLPQSACNHLDMVQQFEHDLKVCMAKSTQRPQQSSKVEDPLCALLHEAGDLASKMQGKTGQWLMPRQQEHRDALLCTATFAMVGLVGVAAQSLVKEARVSAGSKSCDAERSTHI